MNTNKKTARVVGALFITATVASILATFGFLEPILNAPDYLINVSANETQWIIGVLIDAINSAAVVVIAVMLFPIFKKYNEALALGAVVFRGALETVTYIAIVICWLLLITLSLEYVKAGAPDASYFQTLGILILEAAELLGYILSFVFSIGALMIYYLFYQTKLIPRWLSVWGLIGAIFYFAQPLLALFGSELDILFAPLALQEMVLAVWLIVKGFNSSAIASGSEK